MNNHFKPLPHEPKKPVTVEREHPDRLVIEGVLYDGDYFREFGHPDTDVLYAVRKDAEGAVCLTLIRSIEEAKEFFEKVEEAL